MNTKKITISLKVPKEYNWTAIQPYGSIIFFKDKPTIFLDEDGITYWAEQDDEIETDFWMEENQTVNWKKSLRRI